MIFTKTKLAGVVFVEPEPHKDYRGYFERIYCKRDFGTLYFPIVQINQSKSLHKGTIRGPHMQLPPHSEKKLIQCIRGSIFDVVIDVRNNSKTYGQWIGNILSADNQKMTYIPENMMHGFQSLEDNTVVQYPVSAFYEQESVTGIRWDDPYFNISWPIAEVIASEIDKQWPTFFSDR